MNLPDRQPATNTHAVPGPTRGAFVRRLFAVAFAAAALGASACASEVPWEEDGISDEAEADGDEGEDEGDVGVTSSAATTGCPAAHLTYLRYWCGTTRPNACGSPSNSRGLHYCQIQALARPSPGLTRLRTWRCSCRTGGARRPQSDRQP